MQSRAESKNSGHPNIDAFSFAERTVYYYPDYTITPDQVVNHPLGLVTLAPIEGLCKTKAIDECTNECTRCQNECLYNMELHRSGSACNVKGKIEVRNTYLVSQQVLYNNSERKKKTPWLLLLLVPF